MSAPASTNGAGAPTGLPGDDLWAITSYFNPLGYRRRLANHRIFRERLNGPLVTVELGYGGDFALGKDDADILIQLRGGDVLWQKERLLNIALGALPAACRKVAWVDCDLYFAASDWRRTVSAALDRAIVVQAFAQVHHLRPDSPAGETSQPAIDFSQASVVAAIAAGVPARTQLGQPLGRDHSKSTRGFAWAARRDLLEEHGFYDACIVGGGDTAFACAAYGCFEEAMRLHAMNDKQRARYMAWAGPLHELVQADVAHADLELYHLWHGDLIDRRPRERHERLSALGFDPFADIAADHGGSWRWASDKPALHGYVRDYFAARREDG